jgi:hypothetical protein
MGRALRGQDTLDLKVALEYADLLDPPPKPPPTLVERMLRAYGKEFYGECWPSVPRHVDQLDAMAAALAVVRAEVEELIRPNKVSPNYNIAIGDVLDLLGGDK